MNNYVSPFSQEEKRKEERGSVSLGGVNKKGEGSDFFLAFFFGGERGGRGCGRVVILGKWVLCDPGQKVRRERSLFFFRDT